VTLLAVGGHGVAAIIPDRLRKSLTKSVRWGGRTSQTKSNGPIAEAFRESVAVHGVSRPSTQEPCIEWKKQPAYSISSDSSEISWWDGGD